MFGLLVGGSRSSRRRLAMARAAISRRGRAAAVTIAGLIGPDEILVGAALVLIAVGMWQVWKPGAFLVPGVVLLWIGIPQRAPFVNHPSVSEKERKKSA